MKKTYILLATIGCLLDYSVQAQTKQVVAAAGGSGRGSVTTIDWTLGETSIATLNSENITITQGFHQPTLTVVPVGTTDNMPVSIDVFPNPVDVYLLIKLPHEDFKVFFYQLYDMHGKLLEAKMFEAENSILPMEDRTEGTYLLKIMKGKQEVGIFKIIKR